MEIPPNINIKSATKNYNIYRKNYYKEYTNIYISLKETHF